MSQLPNIAVESTVVIHNFFFSSLCPRFFSLFILFILYFPLHLPRLLAAGCCVIFLMCAHVFVSNFAFALREGRVRCPPCDKCTMGDRRWEMEGGGGGVGGGRGYVNRPILPAYIWIWNKHLLGKHQQNIRTNFCSNCCLLTQYINRSSVCFPLIRLIILWIERSEVACLTFWARGVRWQFIRSFNFFFCSLAFCLDSKILFAFCLKLFFSSRN